MKQPVVAILASGEGTTAEAFIRDGAKSGAGPQIGLVICNKQDAGIFARIAKLNDELGLGIVTKFISGSNYPAKPGETVGPGEQTKAEEKAILDLLKSGKYDAIILMGYMRKVGPMLVHEFGWRPEYNSPHQANMLNTHAGLFPDTKGFYGRHKQEHVIEQGFPESGTTLHIVATDYDDGPTVAEHRGPVKKSDTVDSLLARDQSLEKKYLHSDITKFIKNRQNYLKKRAS